MTIYVLRVDWAEITGRPISSGLMPYRVPSSTSPSLFQIGPEAGVKTICGRRIVISLVVCVVICSDRSDIDKQRQL